MQKVVDMFLTKEALAQNIQNKQTIEAQKYGLTLEQYVQAVISGSVLTPINNETDQRPYHQTY